MEKFKNYLKKIYTVFIGLDKKKRAYLITGLTVVAVMLWAFISAGIITGNFNRAQLKGTENEQKVDALGLIITETKEGKKYFEIYGETGHYSNDHSIATLYNVIGNFYKGDDISMSFQSSKGTYDETNKIITLYENTYIVLSDGISLNTDKLTWSGNDKATIAEGNVIIKKGNEMISKADKCIISPGYDKFKIAGKTQTKVFKKE